MKKIRNISLMIALALLSVFCLMSCAREAEISAQSLPPVPASVVDVEEISWYAGGVGVSTTTYYYGPTTNGTQGQNVLRWNEAEFFLTVDLDSGQTFTVTPQTSADGTNWADLKYTVEQYAAATVATTTETYQAHTVTRQTAFTADGTEILSIPLYGKYMRLKTEVITSASKVTPTFKLILKNK